MNPQSTDPRDGKIETLQVENAKLRTENAKLRVEIETLQEFQKEKAIPTKDDRVDPPSYGGRGACRKGDSPSEPELSLIDAVIEIVKECNGTCLLSYLGIQLKNQKKGYGDHPKLRNFVESIAQLKVEGKGPKTSVIIRKEYRDVPSDATVYDIVKKEGCECFLTTLGDILKNRNFGYGNYKRLRDFVESIEGLNVRGIGIEAKAIIVRKYRDVKGNTACPSEE